MKIKYTRKELDKLVDEYMVLDKPIKSVAGFAEFAHIHRDTIHEWRTNMESYGNSTYKPVPDEADTSLKTPIERLYTHIEVWNTEHGSVARNPVMFMAVLNAACGYNNPNDSKVSGDIKVNIKLPKDLEKYAK